MVHPHEPATVFVFPLGGGEGGMGRYAPDGRPLVWRSRDAGETWEALGQGLPERAYVGVMRDAMCTDDHDEAGLYLGTRAGSVWASFDDGSSWSTLAADLPDVLVVRAARVRTA